MSHLQIAVSSPRSIDLGATKGRAALRKAINHLMGVVSGSKAAGGWLIQNCNTTAALARSVAGITMATGTGTVGSVINGTSVTATWGTSDTATAAALVTAINANTTVNPLVMASKYAGKFVLTTAIAGDTLVVGGVTFTGVAGTADYAKNQFSIDTSDTAAALDLSISIQSHPELNQRFGALAVTDTCWIFTLDNSAVDSTKLLASTTATCVPTAIAAGAYYFIAARQPGLLGNACTATATGTNMTAVSQVSGKLGGGRGGYLSTSQYITSATK